MAVTDQHYVRQPAFVFFIHIAQVVLSIIILGLASYAVSVLPDFYYGGSLGFNIFTVIYTWIVIGYLLGTSSFAIALWNCWAALVLKIFAVLFWLSAWSSLAAWAGAYGYVYGRTYGYKRYIQSDVDTAWQCIAAGAGLGALMWVLWIVVLVVYSINLHRHRTNPENANLPNNGEPVREDKHEMGNVPQQGYSA